MKIGVFGDVHLTKNMRSLQFTWESSVSNSLISMYKEFDKQEVDFVICLGDFFDKPLLEAKNLHLVLPMLYMINTKSYPTYLLLGNHEIDDDEHNILEYLSEYRNIKTITDYDIIRNECVVIPYNVDPLDLSSNFTKDKYVFTHHDIYGSDLAGGKTKAFFGLDPSIFQEANLVFNGHVHLRSKPYKNIINAGSLLSSQQGELRLGDYPQYYILNTDSGVVSSFDNKESMIFLNINESELPKIEKIGYEPSRLVLRVDYEGDIPQLDINIAHISWRKLINNIKDNNEEMSIMKSSNFDLKNYLVEYIKKDTNISDENIKQEYITTGLELLS